MFATYDESWQTFREFGPRSRGRLGRCGQYVLEITLGPGTGKVSGKMILGEELNADANELSLQHRYGVLIKFGGGPSDRLWAGA